MYEDLVKALRNCSDCYCGDCKYRELLEPGNWVKCQNKLIDEAADAIEELIADRDKYKRHSDSISQLPDCNTCGKKAKGNCEFMPRCGDWVRINCAFWTPEPPKDGEA
jgi:hypothetical protein